MIYLQQTNFQSPIPIRHGCNLVTHGSEMNCNFYVTPVVNKIYSILFVFFIMFMRHHLPYYFTLRSYNGKNTMFKRTVFKKLQHWECVPNRSAKTDGGCLRIGSYPYMTLEEKVGEKKQFPKNTNPLPSLITLLTLNQSQLFHVLSFQTVTAIQWPEMHWQGAYPNSPSGHLFGYNLRYTEQHSNGLPY